ncbi:GxxExxY protein [Pedobacter alluvionis]|nr:GxxExxY protein [Pedobacter alluvionis]
MKAISNILPVHHAQLQTYMKLLNAPQGLLINFSQKILQKALCLE